MATLFLAAGLLAGCSGTPSADAPSPSTSVAPPSPVDQQKADAPPPTRNPLGAGIDVVNYPIDDARGSIGRALASWSDRAVPIPPAAAELWHRHGLRVLAVPAAEVEGVLRSLPLAGTVQRQSFGVLTRWTPIAIGGSWTGSRVIGGLRRPGATADLVLPAGRLRMLARAWDEPVVDGSVARARLRLELLPQHEQTDPDLAAVLETPKRPIDRAGRPFDELSVSMMAVPGEVYLIVPEAPGVEWQRAEDASNDRPGVTPTRVDPGAATDRQPPTLGEAMLSNAAYSGSASVKVVVVLVPRSAEVFELLPPRR